MTRQKTFNYSANKLSGNRNEYIQYKPVPVYIYSQNSGFPAKFHVTRDLQAVLGDGTVSW